MAKTIYPLPDGRAGAVGIRQAGEMLNILSELNADQIRLTVQWARRSRSRLTARNAAAEAASRQYAAANYR